MGGAGDSRVNAPLNAQIPRETRLSLDDTRLYQDLRRGLINLLYVILGGRYAGLCVSYYKRIRRFMHRRHAPVAQDAFYLGREGGGLVVVYAYVFGLKVLLLFLGLFGGQQLLFLFTQPLARGNPYYVAFLDAVEPLGLKYQIEGLLPRNILEPERYRAPYFLGRHYVFIAHFGKELQYVGNLGVYHVYVYIRALVFPGLHRGVFKWFHYRNLDYRRRSSGNRRNGFDGARSGKSDVYGSVRFLYRVSGLFVQLNQDPHAIICFSA